MWPGLSDRLREGFTAFQSCLPRAALLWFAKRRPVLVVRPVGDDAELMLAVLDERQTIGHLDLRTSGTIREMIGGSRHKWVAVQIELPAADVLLRTVTLPIQVRDNLRGIVFHELDRLTPFQSDDVFFDAHAKGTAARGTKVIVDVAVCRRESVADWLDRLREAGSPAGVVTWPGAWTSANLLPDAERPRQRRLGASLTLLLALLVVGLGGAALFTPIWQKEAEQEQLQRALTRLRVQAEDVTQVREQLERARYGSIEVLQQKRRQPRMTDLLRELTDLLPDHTWVQTMNVRDKDVDIRGESAQATALIGLLEKGPGISGVSFRSPVMQVGGTGNERFHISFVYERPAAE
jgi:general secretion pathway protein L